MEEIYESRMNYLSESELNEFKFVPVMPIHLHYDTQRERYVFRINKQFICQHNSFNKIMERYYLYCKKNNMPFV